MARIVQRTGVVSLCALFALILVIGSMCAASAYAAESDDLQAQADEAAAASAEKQAEADVLAQTIDSLQTQLNDAQAQYDDAQAQYEEAVAAAEAAQKRAEEAQARMAELRELLSDRVVDMYKGGGSISFLQVVLGASSMQDMLTYWDFFDYIFAQDADLIEESKQVRQEAQQAQQEYTEQSQRAADEMAKAEAAKSEIQSAKSSMESELSKMTEEIALLQGQADYLQESADEARAREEAAAAVVASSSFGGSGSYYSSGTTGNGTANVEGWVIPVSYYGVTCEFGYSPITGSHTGIDLGAAEGTPIYSAGPGTVTYVGWYGTGGNAVIVSHGNGVRTIYMHQSRTAATVGQTVAAGDLIGYVGSTGLSTGPHLHFTIEINGTAVNPRNYFSF